MRVRLLKSWANVRGRVYPVGTILQVTSYLASELLADKTAENYSGDYPPKSKMKMNLKQLNNK